MKKKVGALAAAVIMMCLTGQVAGESGSASPPGFGPVILMPEAEGLSVPLRDLKPATDERSAPLGEVPSWELPRLQRPVESAPSLQPDGAVQSSPGLAPMPAATVNFDGVNNVNGVLPPDTNGDVGPNHYVQWVNLSFAIYNKSGVKLVGPLAGNVIWQGLTGSACASENHGDPIVLYDPLADRWLMSQFAIPGGGAGYHQCVAVSQTGDPTGSWHLYDFAWPGDKFNDYPKFGVWPDGYYMTANQFKDCDDDLSTCVWGGAGVAVLERSKMLAGQSARMIYFDLEEVNPNFGGILPADLDGAEPPEGAPGLFLEMEDDAWGFPQDQLSLWEFHADWTTPVNSTFGIAGEPNLSMPAAAFDFALCCTPSGCSRNCIPQPGGLPKLDALSDRLMHRLQYRNFGDHQTLVVCHSVDENGSDHAAVRWYEIEDNGSGWAIRQQGTYAPDANHRWMPSAAMDGAGNIAIGYSVSSTTVSPSIRYAGRLSGDPLNTLPQGESVIVAGLFGQEHASGRWGDYSAMSVDPTDDCTFWYTQEYYNSNLPANDWKTRIASFKFPSCTTGAKGDLEGTITNNSTALPIPDVRVAVGFRARFTNAAGGYLIAGLPAGNVDVSVVKYGYQSQTASGVVISNGVTTTLDLALVPQSWGTVQGLVRDSVHHWPLYARVAVSHPSGYETEVFTDPATGTYQVSLALGETVTVTVSAVYPGYLDSVISLKPFSNPTVRNFDLIADSGQETCPIGYQRQSLYSRDFEANNGSYSIAMVLPGNSTSSWQWGVPSSGPKSAHSGTRVWATNLAGNYLKGEHSCITSPVINLSAATGKTLMLSWWQWLQNEPFDWDLAYVEVSNNGGVTWNIVYGPKSGNIDLKWTKRFTTLGSSFAVSNFRVRYCLFSDSSVVYPGWYIDDIAVDVAACGPVAGGIVVGSVRDENTGLGLVGATVADNEGRSVATVSTPDDPAAPDGIYQLFQPAGSRSLRAYGVEHYGEDNKTVAVIADNVKVQDFDLPAGLLSVNPASVDLYASPAAPVSRGEVIISNPGGAVAVNRLWEINRPYAPTFPSGPFAAHTRHLGPKNIGRTSIEGMAYYQPLPAAAPLAAGGLISEFTAISNSYVWGLAYDTTNNFVWVGDYYNNKAGNDRDYKYLPAGTPGGAYVDVSGWKELYAADMAYNPLTARLWQVNVGGDNCIYEMDPATNRNTGKKICPPFGTSERGLAYDPLSDTFYSGSWNDGIINHFDQNGVLLDSKDVGLPIAGLAFNPATGRLFATVNTAGPDVYVLDPDDGYTIVGSFSIAGLDDYSQAGLDMDCAGNLWAVDMNNSASPGDGSVIKAESGEASDCSFDIPWLTVTPSVATIAPGGAVMVRLTANAAGLAAGNYSAHLRMYDDSPYGTVSIPVTLHVVSNKPPLANAGPDQWVVHNAPVQFDGSSSADDDGTIATYSWVQSAGPAVALTGSATSTPAFTAPAGNATLTFTLTVKDNGNATDTDQVTVTVSANQAPIANAGADLLAAAGWAVQLTGTASSDPDGSIASWSWIQVEGTYVQLANPTSATPVFSAPAITGSLVFQLTVTDNLGARDSDLVAVSATTPPAGGGGGGDDGGWCGCMIASSAGREGRLAAAIIYALPLLIGLGLRFGTRRKKAALRSGPDQG